MFTCCARPEAELLGHLPPVVGVLGLDLHLVVRLHLQLDNINQWELSTKVTLSSPNQWELSILRSANGSSPGSGQSWPCSWRCPAARCPGRGSPRWSRRSSGLGPCHSAHQTCRRCLTTLDATHRCLPVEQAILLYPGIAVRPPADAELSSTHHLHPPVYTRSSGLPCNKNICSIKCC